MQVIGLPVMSIPASKNAIGVIYQYELLFDIKVFQNFTKNEMKQNFIQFYSKELQF